MRKWVALGLLTMVFLSLQAGYVLANKSSTSIEGPASVPKGTEVTLRITVSHNANTSSHHTEWVKVRANGKEIARWDYTKDNLPEGAEFTKEIKLMVKEDTEIIAEASCNKHGSRGPSTHKITAK